MARLADTTDALFVGCISFFLALTSCKMCFYWSDSAFLDQYCNRWFRQYRFWLWFFKTETAKLFRFIQDRAKVTSRWDTANENRELSLSCTMHGWFQNTKLHGSWTSVDRSSEIAHRGVEHLLKQLMYEFINFGVQLFRGRILSNWIWISPSMMFSWSERIIRSSSWDNKDNREHLYNWFQIFRFVQTSKMKANKRKLTVMSSPEVVMSWSSVQMLNETDIQAKCRMACR